VTATTFTARATRAGAQSTDNCGDFTIDDRGVQGNVNNTATTAQCW
jgi:Tfp pilus assembly protein PilE